ncbi:MAG: hypothetical protein AAF846_09880 [Chloroflexota bacterium]
MLRISFLVMLSIIMVGCGAGNAIDDVPFYTATPNPLPTVESERFGDVDIPSDFTSGEPIILSSGGTFSFNVSGEVVSEVSVGTLTYNYLASDELLPARNELYIAASDAIASQELTFQFLPSIELGQYPLVAPQDYSPGRVSVAYNRLAFNGTDARIESFTENIEGTLTLTRVGEALSGQFQFSAQFIETSPQGEVDVQTVEVTGQFEDVPYQVTLDDPFDLNVPLPTRNFDTDNTQQP